MDITVDAEILASFLAGVLGKNCEVVIHDLKNKTLKNSVVAIKNNSISGRNPGSGAGAQAEELIKKHKKNNVNPYEINYQTTLASGESIRSSSLIVNKKSEGPRAMICCNFDDSALLIFRNYINNVIGEDKHFIGKKKSSNDIMDVGHKCVEEILSKHDIPPKRMSQEEKIEVIKELNEAGVFLVKGFISIIAEKLAISDPTVYRYLQQIEKES